MSEFPVDSIGDSRYGIDLTPRTSPAYYIFAESNSPPYATTEPMVWLSTSGFAAFYVTGTNVPISTSGVFALPTLPSLTQLPADATVLAGQNVSFSSLAGGSGIGYEWVHNGSPLSGAASPVLSLTNVSAASAGCYVVTITNQTGGGHQRCGQFDGDDTAGVDPIPGSGRRDTIERQFHYRACVRRSGGHQLDPTSLGIRGHEHHRVQLTHQFSITEDGKSLPVLSALASMNAQQSSQPIF